MMTNKPLLLHLVFSLALAACDDSAADDENKGAAESTGTTTDAGDDDPMASTDPTAGPDDPGPTSGDPETSGPTSDSDDPTDDPTGDTSDTDDETTGATETCGPDGVPCEDAMILDLGLVGGAVSEGAVESTPDADGWISSIDATAGGIVDAPSNPWVYLRFTDDGLEKVAVDDLEALESVDWHIAAKRFGIRLNSGSSGPGCVTVATHADVAYADLEAPDPGAELRPEAFYDDACGLVDDGSGAGGANYALTPWWFYPGCVGVTYVPFVLELEDGRHVKFMVESYYESGQAECNDDGAMGSGSANFTWRWAFLD